ncbi:hypothetical protein Peur_043200 [Populus x canadensis]
MVLIETEYKGFDDRFCIKGNHIHCFLADGTELIIVNNCRDSIWLESLTGDCAGLLQRRGIGVVPPATLVEMTLGTSKSALHYYDVSLVDGFNVPVSMMPVGGGVACGIAACETDLNVCCPSTLVVKRQGKVVGCKSACLDAKTDRYCCTGEYANPKSCKPTIFGHLSKAICPKAYSFALDDASGLKTCKASRYVITFCPPN